MSKEIRAQIRLLRWLWLDAEKRNKITARYNQMLGRRITGAVDRDESDPKKYDAWRREQIATRRWNRQNKEGDYD